MFVFLWTGIRETLDYIPLQGLAFIPNETHQHISPNFTHTPACLSFSVLTLRPAFPQEYVNFHNPRTQRNPAAPTTLLCRRIQNLTSASQLLWNFFPYRRLTVCHQTYPSIDFVATCLLIHMPHKAHRSIKQEADLTSLPYVCHSTFCALFIRCETKLDDTASNLVVINT